LSGVARTIDIHRICHGAELAVVEVGVPTDRPGLTGNVETRAGERAADRSDVKI
jgi:tryptophan synthase alpha subunit